MRIDHFLELPTQEQWEAELDDGWFGPYGSSMSTDHMMGIRIGVTSPDYRHHRLPANLHDWRYRLGRKHKLSARHRHAADVAYRKDCIAYIKRRLDGRTMEAIGVFRAWIRYYALRLFGGGAWKG